MRCLSEMKMCAIAGILFVICLLANGCTSSERVIFRVVDAISHQPLDNVSVTRTTITEEHLIGGPSVASQALGSVKGGVYGSVLVSSRDIIEFYGDPAYYRTRVQVSGHVAWILSDVNARAREYGLWEALVRGDPFDRNRAQREEIERDGVVTVPMKPMPAERHEPSPSTSPYD